VFYWIYDRPSLEAGLIFTIVFVSATWLSIFVARPTIHAWLHRTRSANEMLGLGLTSFSTFFGILLGLLAVASYQDYSVANDLVDKEGASITAMYRDFSGYPQPSRVKLEDRLRDYVRYTIDVEWPQQRRGVVSSGGDERVSSLFEALSSFEPGKKSEEILHAEALRQFNQFVEIRRARIANAAIGLPVYFWWVVAIGSALNIILIAMLDMEIHVHFILGGVLAVFLATMIFLIAKLDYPFRGQASNGPDAIVSAYETLPRRN
jgi:hypothetical protein